MTKKNLLIVIITVIIIALIIVIIPFKSQDQTKLLTVEVKRGQFESLVYSTGQLESAKSDNIYIPEKLKDRRTRIGSLTITDMIEDGTLVDSGDYVATLDHAAVEEQLGLAIDKLEKVYSEYEDSKIDSNLTLSNQRDEIVNATLDVEEKKITVTESVYESPSIKQKAEMDYDKAVRKLEQAKKAYQLKTEQEINKVARKFINYKQIKERVDLLEELYKSLVIYSPRKGIISYYKYPWGEITKTGSQVDTWRTIIASFPDMSNLISTTYINEIDISKVKIGQKVKIGIDAFPKKELHGEISTIANIGQLMPKSDAKVFEVKIKIFATDNDLRPSMTTKNIIHTDIINDTVFIPIDAVFANDSLQFVYLLDGSKLVKQIIETGPENENYIIVARGINESDEIYLTEPDDAENLPLTGTEIFTDLKQKKEKEAKEKDQQKKMGTDELRMQKMRQNMIVTKPQ